MIEPIGFSDQLLVLDFSSKPVGPPNLESLTQNRQIFKGTASVPVTGDIQGIFTEFITEVQPIPPPKHQGITITFE
jgi:hypothetical protein